MRGDGRVTREGAGRVRGPRPRTPCAGADPETLPGERRRPQAAAHGVPPLPGQPRITRTSVGRRTQRARHPDPRGHAPSPPHRGLQRAGESTEEPRARRRRRYVPRTGEARRAEAATGPARRRSGGACPEQPAVFLYSLPRLFQFPFQKRIFFSCLPHSSATRT